jgi:hypothetical protein
MTHTGAKLKLAGTKSIQGTELSMKVEEASRWTAEEKAKVIMLLLQYKKHFTSKQGRGKDFEYKFKVTPEEPLVRHSRPIPF